MTSSFKVKYGQTFDNIFIEGEGTQTFGIIDSDGVDVGQKYLPVSDGDPQDPCGFLDSTGEDIGPKLCKPGTNWTHIVTPVSFYTTEVLTRWGTYAATKTNPYVMYESPMGFVPVGGSIVTRDGETSLIQLYSLLFNSSDTGWGCWNILALEGVTDGEYWKVTRIDTKKTFKVKAYRYTTVVYGNSSISANEVNGTKEDCAAACILQSTDAGKAVYLKIEKA